MRFKIGKSSDYKFEEIKEFDSIEQAHTYCVLLSGYDGVETILRRYFPKNDPAKIDYTLEIYDTYRE